MTKQLTLKEAQAICRGLGMILTKTYDEYRVNLKHGREATAYYTNSLDDAVRTAENMRDESMAPRHP